jgi:hypothetical protein
MISDIDNHQAPSAPVLPLLPNDLWQAILRHLDINANEVALVSQQFLAAWRAGVVGVYVHIPRAHALSFLLEDRFNAFPNLKFVDLSDNRLYRLRHPGERELALARPGISLQLTLTSRVRLAEVTAFFAQHPRWAAAVTQVAVFAGNNDFAQAWALIRLLPNLVSLRLSGFADLTDDHLRALCCLPSLRQLAVLMSSRFTGEGLDAIADPDCGIQSLEFRHCALSGDHLHHLSNNPRLHRLMLVGCRRLKPQDLCHLHSLPALKLLSVRENAQLDNAGLKLLAERLPQLEVLDIGYCGSIGDEGLAELARLQQLNYLSLLGCCRFSEQAVHELAAKLPALTEIAAHRLLNTTGEPMGAPRNAKNQAVDISSVPPEL